MTTLDDLGLVWRAWVEVGTGLSGQRWAAGTRLPGWTVADVYAHHSAFPQALIGVAGAPPTTAPPTHPDAAALLRAFNDPATDREVTAGQVRDHAIALAAASDRSELVDRFRVTGPEAVRLAGSVELDRPINYGGVAVLPFGEALRIGLMEAVVHYLDLARALGLEVPGPVSGGPLRATAALLTEVADPLAFVEQATGRGTIDVLPVIR